MKINPLEIIKCFSALEIGLVSGKPGTKSGLLASDLHFAFEFSGAGSNQFRYNKAYQRICNKTLSLIQGINVQNFYRIFAGKLWEKSMFKMKSAQIVIFAFLACLSFDLNVSLAQDEFVKFGWTPNDEPELSHYHIYRDKEPGTMIYLDEIPRTDTTYTDNTVILGETYYYKLTAVDSLGNESVPSDELMITIGVVSALDNAGTNVPEKFELKQNYPNPFNPTTTIAFSLPEQNYVTFTIFNVLGKEIRSIDVGTKQAGNHSIQWDGKDNHGQAVASGIYFYHMKAGNFSETKKSILKK